MNELLEMEKIKQLKARYFRALDTNDWELFGACLRENCISRYAGGRHSFDGRDATVKFMSDNLSGENMLTLHQGHTPEIELIGSLKATGTWYLEDTVIDLKNKFRIYGAGVYHDVYEKVNGHWLISEIGYDRTFECAEPLPENHRVIENCFAGQ